MRFGGLLRPLCPRRILPPLPSRPGFDLSLGPEGTFPDCPGVRVVESDFDFHCTKVRLESQKKSL
jgi:hypothetical protein